MSKKLTGLAASGQAQPEIMNGDIWKDSHGLNVTVIHTSFNRVIFLRSGYEFPCTYPITRFDREFKFISRENQQ